MGVNWYILNDRREPVLASAKEWSKWRGDGEQFGSDPARVALSELRPGLTVSTVFLGLDCRFPSDPDPRPVLFETMLFVPETGMSGEWMERTRTWAEAEEAHKRGLAEAMKILKEQPQLGLDS